MAECSGSKDAEKLKQAVAYVAGVDNKLQSRPAGGPTEGGAQFPDEESDARGEGGGGRDVRQRTMKQALQSSKIDKVKDHLADFFVECNISTRCIENRHLALALAAVQDVDRKMPPLTRQWLSGPGLERCKSRVDQALGPVKDTWSPYGGSNIGVVLRV